MDDHNARRELPSGAPDSGDTPGKNEAPPDRNERLAHYLEMLTDDNEDNRWKAAESLGRMKDPAAVDPLIDTLWDDDARVRLKAAWALGRIGDPRALRPLQRLYRMENEWAQEIIGQALEEIKEQMNHQ